MKHNRRNRGITTQKSMNRFDNSINKLNKNWMF